MMEKTGVTQKVSTKNLTTSVSKRNPAYQQKRSIRIINYQEE